MTSNKGHASQRKSAGGGNWLSRVLGIGIYTIVVVQIILASIVERQEPGAKACEKCEKESRSELAVPSKPPINSFVCINGQLERLELENKVLTVLEPIRNEIGGNVDVALIVTLNKAIYTKAKVSEQRAQHEPQFARYREAVAYLESRGFNVVSKGPVEHAKDPVVYKEYLWRLAQTASDEKLKDPAFFAYDKGRAQNHVRQAISGELCYRHMVATGKNYSQGIVSRWRDDVGFVHRLPISSYHQWLHDPPAPDEGYDLAVVRLGQKRPTMITPFCRNWQGMNDRGAFVHPDGAYSYFMAPMVAFTKAQSLPKDRVCNHERFLRHIYNQEGFLFVPSRHLYPIPMFRNDGKGVFREEERFNQLCRIWWPSYRPDCPRQDEKIKLLDGSERVVEPTVSWESAKVEAHPSVPSANNTSDYPNGIVSFVCINGQLERLELENKIENLLNPIREDIGGSVDIALVVSENKALYTKMIVSKQRAEHEPAFSNYQVAVDYLKSRGFNVITTEPAPHSEDPMVYPEYEIRLAQLANDQNIKRKELFERNKKRAQNHVRQAISGELCYRHMLSTGNDYSRGIVTRWRDDVGFEHRLDIAKFNSWIHDPPPIKEEDDFGAKKPFRPTMVTPHCRNWNGLNDRGAFVHPYGAYAYFMAPLTAFTSALPLPSKRVCNYERFLRYLYNEEGFYYVPTRQLYPVPMFRNNGTGVFREEELKQQCLAFWHSWTVDCPRNDENITILR
eukprot:scaffold2334_cov118-Cylindrotheca_fusiformis.AAC.21